MVVPKYYNSLHVTPLVEIFNITVNGNGNDAFEVYGSIKVNDRGHIFSIYDQTEDTAQSMVSDGKLLLVVEDDLDDAVIIPSENVVLSVNLSAICGDGEITLQGSIPLVRTVKDDWLEEYQNVAVPLNNNNWTVKVQYAIFPYAVTASVTVIHFSKDDSFDDRENKVPKDDSYESRDELDHAHYEQNSCSDITNLYGSVFAFAAVCGNDGKRSTLFDTALEDCEEVVSGENIGLLRSVVAVPAYSSLKVEVSISDGSNESPIAEGTVEFKATYDWRPYKKDIVSSNGRVRVQVVWSFGYGQLYKHKPSDMWAPTSSDDDCSDDSSSETDTSNWVLPASTRTQRLLELFSIVVCSKDGKPFKFHGEILFAGAGPSDHIFERDASSAIDCPTSGMSVILKDPPLHGYVSLLQNFALFVDIRDASSHAIISRGLIPFHLLDRKLLLNRRICSVIRGELGFAVVHYSIFPGGVSASVEFKVIKLSDKYLSGIIIEGQIFAEYGNCEPGICYEDKYFKNLLFCDEVRVNDSERTLPLRKSRLSLPIDSFLIIEAVLSVSTVDGPKDLEGKQEFYNNDTSPMHLGDDDLCLEVSVGFSEY